jgi:hypothetical protein
MRSADLQADVLSASVDVTNACKCSPKPFGDSKKSGRFLAFREFRSDDHHNPEALVDSSERACEMIIGDGCLGCVGRPDTFR